MSCQREIAEKVVARGGDYVLALKGNQGTLHADVGLFLDDPLLVPDSAHTDVDGGHGRIETRTAMVSTDIGWLQEQHQWPALAAIAKVIRTRQSGAKLTTETAYYLLSAPLGAKHLGDVVRGYWGYRKQPALGARRHHERGSNQKPQGQWPRKPRPPATLRPQPRTPRTVKRLHEGQT